MGKQTPRTRPFIYGSISSRAMGHGTHAPPLSCSTALGSIEVAHGLTPLFRAALLRVFPPLTSLNSLN